MPEQADEQRDSPAGLAAGAQERGGAEACAGRATALRAAAEHGGPALQGAQVRQDAAGRQGNGAAEVCVMKSVCVRLEASSMLSSLQA